MAESNETIPEATPKPTQPQNNVSTLSSNKVMILVNLGSRILTFIFLLIALVLLATMSVTIAADYVEYSIHFKDFKAYRYLMATIVIGMVYSLVQIGFIVYQLIMGRRLSNAKAMLLFDFYADKVICGLLATGAGAGYGVTVDMKREVRDVVGSDTMNGFFGKGAATSTLALIAFLFSELSQIVSSYSLPKLH